MKFIVAIALFAAVASARILPADLNLTPAELAEVEEIMAAIYSPSTDPTTAAMLEQMLFDLLGLAPPQAPVHIPAPIDQFHPVHVGPEIIDFPLPAGAIPEAPAAPVRPVPQPPTKNPLVQIIVNVAQDGPVSGSPVQVEGLPSPVVVVDKPAQSVIKPTPVQVVDRPVPAVIKPTPVHVVEVAGESVFKPTPVDVVEQPIVAEPVVVAPIIVAPAVVGPDTLN